MPSAKDLIFKLRSITSEFTTDKAVTELSELDTSLAAVASQSTQSAREVKAAGQSLEQTLDSVATSAKTNAGEVDTATAGMPGGFDKAAAETEATAARMRAAAEDMATGVRTGADKIDVETGHIREHMADTGKEAGSELIGNIAEGIGSGTGSLSDVLQGTLGGITNLAASIPGPFSAAGAAAAAGIGVLFSTIKKQSDESKARVKGLTGAILEAGDSSAKAARTAALDQWKQSLIDAPEKAERLAKGMEAAGLNAKDVQDAVAGTPAEAQKVLDKIEAVLRKNNELLLDSQDVSKEFIDQNNAVGDLEKAIRGANGELSLAKGQADAINTLTGKTTDHYETQSEKLDKLYSKSESLNKSLNNTFRDRSMSATVVVKDQAGRSIRLPDPRTLT